MFAMVNAVKVFDCHSRKSQDPVIVTIDFPVHFQNLIVSKLDDQSTQEIVNVSK